MNQRGSLQLSLGVFVLVVVSSGTLLIQTFSRWQSLAKTQFHLDRRVGKAALKLKETLERVDSLNLEIKTVRASIEAAMAAAAFGTAVALPSLRATLGGLVFAQEMVLKSWEGYRFIWMVQNPIDPLPKLSCVRLSPDAVGPQAVTWMPQKPRRFFLQSKASPRSSAAEVVANEANPDWSARWTTPRPALAKF